ncbi:hypothetical protein EDD22DRAFT_954038 [Suillus occidentalis]|nr:hypothetical protein EDD22DRAFT_954038 [Suillus occidentalis]
MSISLINGRILLLRRVDGNVVLQHQKHQSKDSPSCVPQPPTFTSTDLLPAQSSLIDDHADVDLYSTQYSRHGVPKSPTETSSEDGNTTASKHMCVATSRADHHQPVEYWNCGGRNSCITLYHTSLLCLEWPYSHIRLGLYYNLFSSLLSCVSSSKYPIPPRVFPELTIYLGQDSSRDRVAALCLPTLLDRCTTTMVCCVADEALRGNMPFLRAHEDELLYVLRKVLGLRLWSGTLWAALSESPSKFSDSQPTVDVTLSPSALIADVVKRSPVAHIFYFYSVLCEIASIPRKTPSAWVITSFSPPGTNQKKRDNSLQPHIDDVEEGGDATEVDARTLARKALQVLWKEMGAISQCFHLHCKSYSTLIPNIY